MPTARPSRTRASTLAVLGLLAAAASDSSAQIVLDGSLGPAGPRLGPNYLIPASVGRQEGTNLFHSFSRFNIRPGESATFTAQPDLPVRNIIARVTGGELSALDGPLRSGVPDANLILLNPAGVRFGPGASIDVAGAFVASTADSVLLADGSRFRAALPAAGTTEVLTSAPPAAFGFLGPSPASVEFDASGAGDLDQQPTLAVADGKSLSLIGSGGGVRIVGGRLRATGGRVNLAAANAAGDLRLDVEDLAADLDAAAFSALGPVSLVETAEVRARAAGRVVVRGSSFTLNRSTIVTDSDAAPGRGVDVAVTGPLTISDGGRISSEARGPAPGGPIRLAGDVVSIADLSLDGSGAVSADAFESGRGGDITINAGLLSITRNGRVTALAGRGGGGNVTVTATRGVVLDGTGASFLTGVSAETRGATAGRGGNITITTPALDVIEEAQVSTITTGPGDAGSITIAADRVTVDGRGNPQPALIEARVGTGEAGASGARGNGGSISVTARQSLVVRDGGVISTSTFAAGRGGEVDVAAGDVTLSAPPATAVAFTGIFSRAAQAQAGDAGDAGNIRLTAAGAVRLAGPVAVSSESTGAGRAGAISLAVGDDLVLEGGGRLSTLATQSAGGNITVGSPDAPLRAVVLSDGALISAEALANMRDAGDVALFATERVVLTGGSRLTTSADGAGGNITIDPRFIILSDAAVTANARFAAGGNIRLVSQEYLRSADSVVDASSELGQPGVVEVTAGSLDIAGGLVRLPGGLAGRNVQLEEVCGVRLGATAAGRPVSSFVATGRGGTPVEPGGWVPDLPTAGGGRGTGPAR